MPKLIIILSTDDIGDLLSGGEVHVDGDIPNISEIIVKVDKYNEHFNEAKMEENDD